MKKFSIIMAIVMIMSALTFTLASCGETVDSVVGKWAAEVDIVKAMLEGLKSEGIEGVDISSAGEVTIKLNPEFKEDGTYTIKIETDKDFASKLKEVLKPVFEAYIAQTPEMAEYGVTADSLVEMFGSFSADDMFGEDNDGKYKVDGNKLYLWGADEEMDPENYAVFAFEGNTMKWTAVNGEDSESFGSLLPIVFTAVK